MTKSDLKRLEILSSNILTESLNRTESLTKGGYYILTHENGSKTYCERMNENSFKSIMNQAGAKTLSEGLQSFVNDRFKPLAKIAGYDVSYYDFSQNLFEAYLEPEEVVPTTPKQNETGSQILAPKQTKPDKSKVNTNLGGEDLPQTAFAKRSQNVKKVDLLVKAVFQNSTPDDFVITTDAGEWRPIKDVKNSEGKLVIIWENKDINSIRIETTLFPKDSNEVIVEVKDLKQNGKVVLNYRIEVYVIPTTAKQAFVFLRKVLFNQLKRWIDREVIRLKPFSQEFAFWKSSNPDFAYSFKSPNKNTIVLDLINFVNIAQHPILDDFVEQNNLKHKQNYLRALLDSAEEAGIFRFEREGNEIKILKGPSFNDFLEGKVRRVG